MIIPRRRTYASQHHHRPRVEGVKQSIASEMMDEIVYRSWTPKNWSGSDHRGRVYKRMLQERLLDVLGWKIKASEVWFGSWRQSVANLLTDHFCSIKYVHFNAPCSAAQIPSSSFAATSLLRHSTLSWDDSRFEVLCRPQRRASGQMRHALCFQNLQFP
jgi:5-methylcytosine-specific restriction endonuclease McrA